MPLANSGLRSRTKAVASSRRLRSDNSSGRLWNSRFADHRQLHPSNALHFRSSMATSQQELQGATDDPETLRVLIHVFDEAWIDRKAMFGAEPLDPNAMRSALAKRCYSIEMFVPQTFFQETPDACDEPWP